MRKAWVAALCLVYAEKISLSFSVHLQRWLATPCEQGNSAGLFQKPCFERCTTHATKPTCKQMGVFHIKAAESTDVDGTPCRQGLLSLSGVGLLSLRGLAHRVTWRMQELCHEFACTSWPQLRPQAGCACASEAGSATCASEAGSAACGGISGDGATCAGMAAARSRSIWA